MSCLPSKQLVYIPKLLPKAQQQDRYSLQRIEKSRKSHIRAHYFMAKMKYEP